MGQNAPEYRMRGAKSRPANKRTRERVIAAVIAGSARDDTVIERCLSTPANGDDMLQRGTGASAPRANPAIAALHLAIDAAMSQWSVVEM